MWATLKAFYDSDIWENFRKVLILERAQENGVICEECGKHITESKDIILHHSPVELTLANVNDFNISLNPENIKIVCFDSHNKFHGRFGYCNKHLARRHNGVFIVYGPPMAGKSTYVKENMRRGDIVVDMDSLYQAVSFMPTYDKPDNLKFNVFALRNCLLENIKTRYGMFNSAYVIGGYPKRFDRNKLENDIGAELIFMDCAKEECYRRLDMCGDYRQSNKAEWRQYIDKWFEDYSA